MARVCFVDCFPDGDEIRVWETMSREDLRYFNRVWEIECDYGEFRLEDGEFRYAAILQRHRITGQERLMPLLFRNQAGFKPTWRHEGTKLFVGLDVDESHPVWSEPARATSSDLAALNDPGLKWHHSSWLDKAFGRVLGALGL